MCGVVCVSKRGRPNPHHIALLAQLDDSVPKCARSIPVRRGAIYVCSACTVVTGFRDAVLLESRGTSTSPPLSRVAVRDVAKYKLPAPLHVFLTLLVKSVRSYCEGGGSPLPNPPTPHLFLL